MGTTEFISKAKNIVENYIIEHNEVTAEIPKFEIFVVWCCKTLQNNKCLISSTLWDGMYYEITYNGDKEEFYLDTYKKFENKCIPNATFEELPF